MLVFKVMMDLENFSRIVIDHTFRNMYNEYYFMIFVRYKS